MSTPPELNLSQLEAVNYVSGPSLVIAGAGSGKTRVITQKIAKLIQSGIAPERVAAITFTNKAAAEMRERARKLVGRAAGKVLICTFHALGVRLLRQDGSKLGLKENFSILSSDDVLGVLKDAGSSLDNAQARAWQWQISNWKSEGFSSVQALEAAAGNPDAMQAAIVMAHYEERLLAYQSVDFDDLINLPLKLLREHDDVREKWQKQLGHVLVDEYQDTSSTQYELLKLLTGQHARFTCVGDDDQSIYAWRGATLENLRRLPQDYPQLKIIKLEQNYRSVNSVLKAANSVIGSNPKLFEKTLWSDLGDGDPVRVLPCDHEEHEAERAVQHIQRLHRQAEDDFLAGRAQRRPQWSDYAILYRANHLAKVFEQALRRVSIPYRVSGGESFFERAEIRDLCAWLRLLANQDDDPAFIRAVTTPKRGIGHTSLAKLGELATSSKTSLFEALFSPLLGTSLRNRALEDLHEFGRFVNELEHQARQTIGEQDALVFLQQWLKDIDYEKHLYESAEHEKQAAKRWENVLEFIAWMAKRCGGQANDEEHDNLAAPAKSLFEVVQTVSLLSTLGEREGHRNELTLSTLHASKGLEWPHVILAGVAEGVLPFNRDREAAELAQSAQDDAEYAHSDAGKAAAAQLEEERRLMYVGITRAQRSLLVSWPQSRKKGRDRVKNKPSRFIEEMRLDDTQPKQDPREQLKALRAQIAAKVQNRQQQEQQNAAHNAVQSASQRPQFAPRDDEEDDAPF